MLKRALKSTSGISPVNPYYSSMHQQKGREKYSVVPDKGPSERTAQADMALLRVFDINRT